MALLTKPPDPPAPPVTEKEVIAWAKQFTGWAFRNFMAGKDKPVASILLVSPNRSVYTVAVEDDGTLVTTKVGEA